MCPDFSKTGSCPRGARCKLQHRQRAKRSASNASTTPAKRPRTKEPFKRSGKIVQSPLLINKDHYLNSFHQIKHPLTSCLMFFLSSRSRLSVVIPQGSQAAPGTPTKGPLELPSFISLSSSPEEADAPDTLLAETSKVKGTKIHSPTTPEHLRVSHSVHKTKPNNMKRPQPAAIRDKVITCSGSIHLVICRSKDMKTFKVMCFSMSTLLINRVSLH